MDNQEEKTNKSLESNSTPLQSCKPAQETESDPELDDLLDSALEDFKQPASGQTATQQEEGNQAQVTNESQGAASVNNPQDALFNEVFNNEAQKQLEDMMKALMGDDPNMLQNIEKLAEAAGNTDDSEDSRKQFEQTLQETLGNLAQNAENLQGDVPDEEIFKLLGNLNIDNPEGGGEDVGAAGESSEMSNFMPMMQGMMKSLLSKDVLYPSLKDISEKFPKWLEDNKDKTSPKDLENYNKQYEYMKKICNEYDKEKESDSDSVKKERFDRVLDLMQNMQELGYPPKDLVGDMPAGFPMGGAFEGLPNMPQNSEQCRLM